MTNCERPPQAQATNASASEPSSQPRTGKERQNTAPRNPANARAGQSPEPPRQTQTARNRPKPPKTDQSSQKRARKIPATGSKQHGQGNDIGRVANFSTRAGTSHDQGPSPEFWQISQVGKESQRVKECYAIRARAREGRAFPSSTNRQGIAIANIPSGGRDSAGNAGCNASRTRARVPLGNAIARNPKWGKRANGIEE